MSWRMKLDICIALITIPFAVAFWIIGREIIRKLAYALAYAVASLILAWMNASAGEESEETGWETAREKGGAEGNPHEFDFLKNLQWGWPRYDRSM